MFRKLKNKHDTLTKNLNVSCLTLNLNYVKPDLLKNHTEDSKSRDESIYKEKIDNIK